MAVRALQVWTVRTRARRLGTILVAGLVMVTAATAVVTTTASPATAWVDTRFEVKIKTVYDGVPVDYYQSDGSVVHQWPGSNGWHSLGHPPNARVLGSPSMVRTPDGRLTVFAVAEGNRELWHKWQLCDGCGWSGWVSLGGGLDSNPSAVYRSYYGGGIFVVFALGHDRDVWHTWQTCHGCTWSTWTSLQGGPFTSAPSAEGDTSIGLTVWKERFECGRRQNSYGDWNNWYCIGQ